MEIKKNLTTQNFNAGTISRIKYIVVHYTAGNGDTALANTNYFKQYRGASAHYFVDENNIYQSIEDKNVAWHCGANIYYHKDCKNYNSIGIEMCSYINSKGNYAFKPKTVTNTIELVRYLIEKYNVPIENVIRHYDVTHKVCPAPYVNDFRAWNTFKERIKEDDEMIEKITVKVNGKNYKADRILKEDKNFICIKDLEQAGFDVDYDKDSKIPSISNGCKELKLNVDGNETSVEAVNINGSNFVAIRNLAEVVGGFDVDFVEGEVVVKTK